MSDFWLGWLCGAIPMFVVTIVGVAIGNIIGEL